MAEKTSLSLKPVVQNLRKGYLVLQERKRRESELQAAGIGISIQGIPFPVGYMYPPEKKKKEAEELKIPEGYEIPTKSELLGPPLKEKRKEMQVGTNIFYSLIPRYPKKGERVFAYSNIKWDEKLQELVYDVIEPQITQADVELIERIKRDLEDRLDIDFTKLGLIRAKQLLRFEIEKSLSLMLGVELDPEKRSSINYFIERDIIGLGKIEPLMQDENIEDISCDGINIPIYIYHRDPRIGSLRSNVVFTDNDELNIFVVKISQKCNKTISIAEPLLDGALPDGSRVQATLGTDIARKGSNFTIRKFTASPLTPTHMLKLNTINSLALAYLWLSIDNGMSVLISGGTATGKTSLLNALSLFIRPTMKVVSIEDTAELRLPHPHWIPEVARTPLSIKGKMGEVTLFDLLKSSLRQRPDYIVLGEVRGKEAFVLFQQMATGHPSMATIHAASLPQLVDRLITPPINLPPTLLENINIIVFLTLSKIHDSYVRRTNNVTEVVGIEKDRPVTNNVFSWNPINDSFEIKGKSVVLEMIAKKMGLTEDTIKEELIRRKKVLEWMQKKGVYDYRDVATVISIYYSNPTRIMDLIGEEI